MISVVIQVQREGARKQEAQSAGGWFSGWFGRGKQATTEVQTVGGLCQLFTVNVCTTYNNV